MCGPHWRLVPAPTKIEVYDTLRKVMAVKVHIPRTEFTAKHEAYKAAVEKAKAAVAGREANALRT